MNITHPFWIVTAFDETYRPLYTVGPFDDEQKAEAYATRRVDAGDAPAMHMFKVVPPEEPVVHIHCVKVNQTMRSLQ